MSHSGCPSSQSSSESPVKARPGRLAGRQLLLGVTGSIAAYKAAVLARLLLRDGARVTPILTRAAREFVGPATFAGLTGHPVLSDMFEPGVGGESHVTLASKSDLYLIAPATADCLARLAAGRADDLLTATALCSKKPLLLAPAMHPSMWDNAATQRNVATLKLDPRITFVGPVTGEVASGESGLGRFAEPEEILAAVRRCLRPQDLLGQHVVITAGPTVEDLDPVRFIGNRSSGKMGFALAERAAERGARVTLLSGPVSLPTPSGVERREVRSALELGQALDAVFGPGLDGADALIMAAAVGDYRPAQLSSSKLKRSTEALQLELTPNPDLLAGLGKRRAGRHPVLIGFAVETGSDEAIIDYARRKLREKRVELVVANRAEEALGRDDNRVSLVESDATKTLTSRPKGEVAEAILDWLARQLKAQA